MTRRLNFLMLVMLVLVGLPYYWFLIQNPSRHVKPYPLTMAELRNLADTIPGPRPEGIVARNLGSRSLPGNVYAAGSGLKPLPFAILSFTLPVPGAKPVVIDTGATTLAAKRAGIRRFSTSSQAQLENDLTTAGLILTTSQGSLHNGSPRPLATEIRPAALTPYPVAPGIVVIPAGTPTPGSNLIYVRLGNGHEYIFAGDVAPLGPNFEELRVPSNLIDRNVPRSERSRTMRWLVTLNGLREDAPDLLVVPGHGLGWLTSLREKNVIGAEDLTLIDADALR